jgi:hypothetical protein
MPARLIRSPSSAIRSPDFTVRSFFHPLAEIRNKFLIMASEQVPIHSMQHSAVAPAHARNDLRLSPAIRD